MSDTSKRCVILKGLPANCTEQELQDCLKIRNLEAIKIHGHLESHTDKRWVILLPDFKAATECIKQGPWNVYLRSGEMTVTPDYCSECIIPDAWTLEEEIPESDTVDVTDDSWIKLDIESLPSVKSDDFLRSYHSHSSEEQTSLTPILGAEGQTAEFTALEKLQLLETEDDSLLIFPEEIYQYPMLPYTMAVFEERRSGNTDKTFHDPYFQDVSPQPECCIPQSPKLIGQSTNNASLKSGSEAICIVQSKCTGDQSQTGSQENVKDTDTESIQMKKTYSKRGTISLSKNKSQTPTVDPSVKDKDFNQDRDSQLKSGSQHGKCNLISTFSAENVVSEEDEEDQNEVCLNQHHTEVSVHSENVPPVTSSPVNVPFNVEQIYSGILTGHVMPGYVNSPGVTDRHMVPPGYAGPYLFPLQAPPFIRPGYQMNYSPYYWGHYGMPHLPPQPTVQHVPAQPKCPLPEAMSNTSHQDGAQPPHGRFSGHQEPIDSLRSVDVQAGPVKKDGGSVNMTGKPQCSSNAESFEQTKAIDRHERVEQNPRMIKRDDSDIYKDKTQPWIYPKLDEEQFSYNKDSPESKGYADRVNPGYSSHDGNERFKSHKESSSDALVDEIKRGMNINKTMARQPSEDHADTSCLVDREDCTGRKETDGASVAEETEKTPKHPETPRMIRVCGIAKSISKDALEMFFENTRKSGGGDIENLEWERKKGEAFITFKDPSVVQRVLEKQRREPFSLEKSDLSVEEYVPPPPDPLRLFLKNLSAGITEECLSLYLEPRCNALPTKIIFGRLPGTALVTFPEPPDIGLLLRRVKEKALQGQYIEVTRVPVTRCVQLRGLLPSISRDTVVLYFENVKRSNGGPVKDLKKGRDKQSFYITFEKAEDAERVCRREHTIDKKEIQVCLYYECLDEDLDADDFSDLTHGVEDTVVELKLPDPVRLNNWNPQILRFLKNNRKHRAMFEKNLSDVHGVAKWPSSFEGDVIIECSMKADDEHANSLMKDWTTRVIKMVNSFIAGLDVAEFTLIQMAWPRVLDVLKTITIDNPEDVAVFLDQEKHNIAVAGPRANVQELKNVIKQMIITVEAKIKLEMMRVRETKQLKTFEIALLRMSHFIQEIEKMHPDLKFEIDQKERMAIFDGQADIVQKVMTQMHEKLNSFVSRSMQMSKPARNLLFAKETRKYIKQKMFAQKIVGVWDGRYDELLMFGRGEKEVIKAIQIVTACIVEKRIPLDEAMTQLVQGQQWSQLVEGILKKHTGKCAVEPDIKGILVVAVDDIFQDVFNEVKAFLDYHTVQETFLELNPELVKFIKQYRNDDIMELEKRFEKSLVKLYVADIGKQKGVKIKGTKDGCKSAKVAIAELAKSIITTEHVMANTVGLKELLQGSRGRGQLIIIEANWKCFIAMKNANKPDTWIQEGATGNNTSGSVDDEDQSLMSMDWQHSSENGSAVVYFGKIKVSVIKGELAKQKVDVIVNSTSAKLDLNTGAISKTILLYGGATIQKECLQLCPNGIIPGQVVVTNGGNLSCTKVYHGCLCTYDGSPQGKSVQLMEAFVYNCLKTADQSNVQTIAFPALGTGNLGFPADLVAKLMLTWIKSYSDTKRKQASLKDILLVVYPSDLKTIQAFMAVVGGTTVQSASSDQKVSPSSNITIVPGKCRCKFPGSVAMEIVQGDITKETTDAIVNSVLPDLDLTKGQVSYAILKAGGDSIQQECRVKVGDFKANGFAITRAGRLPCKRIIHMVAKDKREDWEDMIKQVLCQADKLTYQSVSFPALGTGGKGLSPETIAQAMYSACAEFAKSRPNSLKQIRVVLFQDTMWTTFVEAIKVDSSGRSESKTVGRLPRTREKMSSLVLSITADSRSNAQSAIRDIESFVKSEIMEREINSPRDIISKLLDRQVTKMELMGQGKAMVSVNQRKGIILVSGAPKEVLDTYDRVMKYLRNIELDKLKENQEKLKKQQEMNDLRLPVTWTRMANDENLKCVSLNPNDQEYIDVSQKFLASAGSAGQQAVMMRLAMHYGSPGLTVIKIERVQNKSLYQQYKAKKRQLEQQNNGRANEKELWHGTAITSIQNINHNGFNRSYSGSGSHGDGTYFAVNASYSVNGYCHVDAKGHRHIYLAHVMTGDSIVLGSGIRVLPPKDPMKPHITYDSTTDSLANPQMFVIFHDAQAYPSYHITFQ
ncbi:hypothetical protein ACJMK2_005326 [Sinanodonta woodiana]|uniref:Poly [ADP-ribose] polymerase n=1 Tax=Sinanodonta woodiana TaxID=1069815 RepID=A0ABD3VT59_SINWO